MSQSPQDEHSSSTLVPAPGENPKTALGARHRAEAIAAAGPERNYESDLILIVGLLLNRQIPPTARSSRARAMERSARV